MPIEPPPTPWDLPSRAQLRELPTHDDAGEAAQADDLVAVGADLEPGTLLAAYRRGLFPMPEGRSVGWWCPARRGVLELDALRVSRSLRAARRRFEIRIDTAFDDVVAACADPRRPGAWIDRRIARAYAGLHRLGWAHSVEVWREDRLVGGLYGVGIGGLFAGESMFHHETDASKVALVALVEGLRGDEGATVAGSRLIDVQWATTHLRSLGVTEISRGAYLDRLPALLALDEAPIWAA